MSERELKGRPCEAKDRIARSLNGRWHGTVSTDSGDCYLIELDDGILLKLSVNGHTIRFTDKPEEEAAGQPEEMSAEEFEKRWREAVEDMRESFIERIYGEETSEKETPADKKGTLQNEQPTATMATQRLLSEGAFVSLREICQSLTLLLASPQPGFPSWHRQFVDLVNLLRSHCRSPVEAAADALLAVCRDIEWARSTRIFTNAYCPSCGAYEDHGHQHDCALAAAIAKAERKET